MNRYGPERPAETPLDRIHRLAETRKKIRTVIGRGTDGKVEGKARSRREKRRRKADLRARTANLAREK